MNHGSLFSGIGGFDLAAEWMGWENKFHCDINPFSRKLCSFYWPEAESYDNIKTTDFKIWRGKIDVLSGGFPCQPFSPLEKDWEKKMTDIFGPICSKQSETSDPDMSWGRMFVDSLVGRTDWFSKRCTLIWKVRDTKSKRLYFQLSVSTLPTKETESGLLLKTPAAMDAYSENLSKKEQKFGNSGTLAQEVATGFIYKRGILPTPVTQEIETPCELTETGRRKCHNGDSHSLNIGRMASMGMLPTPNSYDWNTAAKPETYLARSQRHKDKNVNLQMSLRQMTMFIPNKVDHPKLGTASQLNPHFVAEMMGFPTNWTDLPFLSGEKNL